LTKPKLKSLDEAKNPMPRTGDKHDSHAVVLGINGAAGVLTAGVAVVARLRRDEMNASSNTG
jgi:LPXTG-motif cell wall-anchored protein